MLHLAQDLTLWMCTHIGSRVLHHQFSNIVTVTDFLGSRDSQYPGVRGTKSSMWLKLIYLRALPHGPVTWESEQKFLVIE